MQNLMERISSLERTLNPFTQAAQYQRPTSVYNFSGYQTERQPVTYAAGLFRKLGYFLKIKSNTSKIIKQITYMVLYADPQTHLSQYLSFM